MDEYRDDFEDYDEESEEVELQAPTLSSKQKVPSFTYKKKILIRPALSDLEAIQNALLSENSELVNRAAVMAAYATNDAHVPEQHDPTMDRDGNVKDSNGAKHAKYVGTTLIGSLSSWNPAMRRMRAVRTRLCLVVEVHMVFNQPPLAEHALYWLSLQSVQPIAKECAVGTADIKVHVQMQCELIEMKDQEAQFANGNDDTEFENLMADIRRRESMHDMMSRMSTTGPRLETIESSSISTHRMSAFIKNVSLVVEELINQVGSMSPGSILAPGGWIQTGKPHVGSTTSIIFSCARACMLLTGFSEQVMQDKTYTSIGSRLLAVWDISQPDVPLSLLDGGATVTCACFAPDSQNIVVAGSTTGALALWDLRERGDSKTGLHHPVYTTCSACRASTQLREHNSCIVNLCPILDPLTSNNGSTPFRLTSIDGRGLIFVWLAVELKGNDSLSPGLCVGGPLHLNCCCAITLPEMMPMPLPGYSNTRSSRSTEVAAYVSAFAILPSEPNLLLVGMTNGYLVKCSRLGRPEEPRIFFASSLMLKNYISGHRSSPTLSISSHLPPLDPLDVNHLPTLHAQATCIKFSPFASDLFLVGQRDGGCRLYQLGCPTPILSWSGETESATNYCLCGLCEMPTADLAWSTQKPGVFFLLHANGELHTFDLCHDDTMPIQTASLSLELNVKIENLPLSLATSRGLVPGKQLLAVSVGGAIFAKATFESRKDESELLSLLRAKLKLQ